MKTDDQLSQLLGTWRVELSPAPSFRHDVWARIEHEQMRRATGPASILREWFVLKLPRPVNAAAFIALFALVGLGTAGLVTTRAEQNQRMALRERYLTSIDPIAMAGERLRMP